MVSSFAGLLSLWVAVAGAQAPAQDAAPAESPTSSHELVVGGPAWVFALPAANVDVAEKLVHRDIVTLNQLVGLGPMLPSKGVVIFFFQRQNGQEALQVLDRLADRWKGQQVRVLAICTDAAPPEEVEAWIAPLGLDYPVLADNYQLVAERYGVRLTPYVVVVDEDGRVFSVGAPGLSELESHLTEEVQLLLGKTR